MHANETLKENVATKKAQFITIKKSQVVTLSKQKVALKLVYDIPVSNQRHHIKYIFSYTETGPDLKNMHYQIQQFPFVNNKKINKQKNIAILKITRHKQVTQSCSNKLNKSSHQQRIELCMEMYSYLVTN